MKKITSLVIALLIFVSCSDSGSTEEPEATIANLSIITTFESGEPASNVSVSIVGQNLVKITNESGIVVFNDLEFGNYNVEISPSFTTAILTQNIDFNSNSSDPFVFIVGPDPISEVAPDIDFLLESSYNALKGENFYDARGRPFYWGDIGCDIVTVNEVFNMKYSELDRYLYDANNTLIADVWTDYYMAIRIVNTALDAIKNSDYTYNGINEIVTVEAEFRFLRALYYFDLVKMFGNPIVVATANIDIDNPPVFEQGPQETYDLIIEDLKFAQQNLLPFAQANIASSEAATALLGKVYTTMGGFPLLQNEKYVLAIIELEKIAGNFSLSENYGAIFNHEHNNEVIFNVDFNASGNLGVTWGPLGVSLDDALLLVPNFLNLYSTNLEFESPVSFPIGVDDNRFYQNIATFSFNGSSAEDQTETANWRPYKYRKGTLDVSIRNAESFDYPYIRMADILLLLAEAENEVNGPTSKAYDLINLVRRRAFENMNNDLSLGMSKQEFLEAILEERRLELCFEGHIKDDLIRTQTLENVIQNFNISYPTLSKEFQDFKHIWPIPQTEINLNPNAVQNPGY